MVDQYSNEQTGNANVCAFVITAADDTVVDYINKWQSVGKGIIKSASKLQVSDSKPSNPNRFHPLQASSS